MALRIRLRVKSENNAVETSALVNSGFETEKPQLLIPLRLARELGLWPPPPDAELIELGTAGGPVRNYLIYDALEVSAITEDRIVGPVKCDALISHIEHEVLINDKLGEELKIIILAMASGKWRFQNDSSDTIRETVTPQHWI
ncbi:MAG: hypothetical protein QXO94_06610 [Candidatus Bathyarchaeia archaeon]